jgi:hypothetical protein
MKAMVNKNDQEEKSERVPEWRKRLPGISSRA